MQNKDIAPNTILEENGELIVLWTVTYTPHVSSKGQKVSDEDRVTIPKQFAALVHQARNENRMLRMSYDPFSGPQTVRDVRLL